MIVVSDRERRQFGPFDCEFIPVTHSVPHGFATAFHTPQGTILHSGDWKLDLTPVDGRRTELSMMGAIAENEGAPLSDEERAREKQEAASHKQGQSCRGVRAASSRGDREAGDHPRGPG